MIKLILKSVVFAAINTLLIVAVLFFFSGRNRNIQLEVADSESNLLVYGDNQHYDIGFLGTSRGRVFSRDGNHKRVETILGKKFVNLAKGGGGGLMPAKVHLSHFYSRGNKVDHIFYLVDPWVFYSPINNEQNKFFVKDEPFELSILWQLLTDGYPLELLFSYLQKIGVEDWQTLSRYAAPGLTERTLAEIEPEKLMKARAYYQSRYGLDSFSRYSKFVDQINDLAQKNNTKITYIMLPLLIADFPGIAQVDKKLRQEETLHDHVSYFDLSTKMQDRHFYYDHMHFNKDGISYFTRKILGPILRSGYPLSMATL